MARNLKKDVFDVDNVGKPINRNPRLRAIHPISSPVVSAKASKVATPSKKRQSKAEESDEDFVISIDLDSIDDTEDEKFDKGIDEDLEYEDVKPKKKQKKSSKAAPVKRPVASHKPLRKRKSDRNDRLQQLLKTDAVVEPLPGRADEFSWIKRTVSGLLESGLGGCLCKKIRANCTNLFFQFFRHFWCSWNG